MGGILALPGIFSWWRFGNAGTIGSAGILGVAIPVLVIIDEDGGVSNTDFSFGGCPACIMLSGRILFPVPFSRGVFGNGGNGGASGV
uniref:Uncharacterized protein n=1 Tax=Panstrongylus lignarius TaxID=156445 RepID=A0A224Y3R8_9HEMI